MNYQGPKAFLDAVNALSKLPGIGEKTAQRLVFHLIHADDVLSKTLATALAELKNRIALCSVCCGLTDEQPCVICKDPKRDRELLCVVEEASDLFAIERTGQFRGVYHVLHGSLAPLDGVGPDQLKIAELMKRIDSGPLREVILATNPDVEGEATALYLARLFASRNVPVSRIALGLPMGGHLEYADQITIGRAMAERRSFAHR